MKLFGNRRRAAYADKRYKHSRGARVAWIAAVVILLLIGGAFAGWKLLVKPVQRPVSAAAPTTQSEDAETALSAVPKDETVQQDPQIQAQVPAAEEQLDTEQPGALREGCYNILICGTDGDGLRTDTIMIAHLDANEHTVALLSIPRDTPIQTSSGLMKINSVYAGGKQEGMQWLCTRLNSLLGFPVDGYVLIDLEAFEKTVELVGGVDFDVPQDMNYDDETQDLHIHLKKGLQHLNGEQAMGLVRYRKGYASQDIQRTQVQQQFLRALAKQCLSVANLTKLKDFADIFSTYVLTDLSVGNMLWFGTELMQCDFDQMQTFTAEGEGVMVNGVSYYALYAGRLLETVNAAFNPYDTLLRAENLTVVSPEMARTYQTNVTENIAENEPEQTVPLPNEAEDVTIPEASEPMTQTPDTESDSSMTEQPEEMPFGEELWEEKN